MPNIRFTRGGKWLHQQCKSNGHGYGGGRFLLVILIFLGIMGILAAVVGIMNCSLEQQKKQNSEIKPVINSVAYIECSDERVIERENGKVFAVYVENTSKNNSADFYVILTLFNKDNEEIYSDYKWLCLSQSTNQYGHYDDCRIVVFNEYLENYYSYQWTLSADKPIS